MAGISSLLRSAAATRKKIQGQEDAMVAFEWENSAQTYEDFLEYSKYLEGRIAKETDPSQQLTYQTKQRSARRSYVSNELQRQQINIMEGRAGTQDKMNAVKELYYQAVDNGDFNLAQNLYSQYDTLSIKLQNEQEAAAKAAESSFKKAAAASSKVYDNLINDLTKGVNEVTLPNGEKVTPLNMIAKDLEETGGGVASWEAAQDTLDALRNVVIDQYKNAKDQEAVDKLEEKYGAGLENIDEVLFFKVGKQELTLQDVMNVAANEQMNNPLYSIKAVRNEVTGKNEFELTRNNVEKLDYIRQFDPATGEEYYVPGTIRTPQDSLSRTLDSQLTDTGSFIGPGEKTGSVRGGEAEVTKDPGQTIGNRLAALGIAAKKSGTALLIKLPGENVERQATIQPDGSIRYYADDGQLIEVGLVDRNLYDDAVPVEQRVGERKGEMRVVSPEEVSDFATNSAFGGTLSRSSKRGELYTQDILGRAPLPTRINTKGPLNVVNNFSGQGTAVTSNLLQSASQVRKQAEIQQQKNLMLQAEQAALMQQQAAQTFNLNQTPVRQLTSNGFRVQQLNVAAPRPTPRLTVAAPKPTPRVTIAAPAPQPRVNIAPVVKQPTITFR